MSPPPSSTAETEPAARSGARRGRGRDALFAALIVPIAAAAAAVAAGPPLAAWRGGAIAWLLVAGVGWAAALVLAGARRPGPLMIAWIVAGALVLRLTMLAGDVRTSDDVYRYCWEGGLVLQHRSPYAWAPDDPALHEQREAWPATFAGINQRSLSAAYPPAAQAVFALVVALSGGVERAAFGMRVAFGLCDLLVLVPLAILLRAAGRSQAWLVAWAWSPLAALEFAGAAHFDSLGILAAVSALAVLARAPARGGGAALLLAFGALVKLLPAALLPFALRGARRPLAALALFLAAVALAYAPLLFFEGGLGGVGHGLGEYGFRCEASSLVYRLIEPCFAHFFAYDEGLLDPRRLARGLVLIAWLAVGAWAWRRRLAPIDAALVLFGAFLILSPTLHPWYVAWILPLLALRPSYALIYLAAAAPLLYWPLAGWIERGAWVEPPWQWPAVAVPFLTLVGWELWRSERRGAA